MSDTAKQRLLIWLPSPLGDAVMSTPALAAIRKDLPDAEIYCLGSEAARQILEPSGYFDRWLVPQRSIIKTTAMLRSHNFDMVILLKNSLSCAITVFMAGIKKRIGYYRDGRSIFLTGGKKPPKKNGKYKPAPMSDYYLNLLSAAGIEGDFDKKLSLSIDDNATKELMGILPQVFDKSRPLVIFVPGGAFGPSKCWLPESFAKVADYLEERYNAQTVVSVAPNESKISEEICRIAKGELIDLATTPLNLAQLKSLIGLADLVIANDTGPRHIAIALNRAVITLFGPNDPEWTDSKHPREIQIITDEPCAPCQKPVCPKGEAVCMRNITPECVCAAADKLLKDFGKV